MAGTRIEILEILIQDLDEILYMPASRRRSGSRADPYIKDLVWFLSLDLIKAVGNLRLQN